MTLPLKYAIDGTYSIGVDLGGTNLRIASYTGGKDFLETIHLPTRLAEGRDQVVRDMCEAILTLQGRSYGDRRFAGIGIGTPGPLELPEGILRNPPNLHGWDGFHLRSAIEGGLGIPVHLESDANVAALAESCYGAGGKYGVDSLCVLTLGTGVGNGLILNHRVWHGTTGMGGEGGHIVVRPDGHPCGCGGNGCLEQYASAPGILRMGRERLGAGSPATALEIASLARAGDQRAISIFETVGESLAIALTALINTLNLQLYLLGGGVCEAWDLFSTTMFRELHRRSYVYRLTQPDQQASGRLERHKTYVLRAQLGSSAGLLGSCLLPVQEYAASLAELEDAVGT